jgi:hypothetical protein
MNLYEWWEKTPKREMSRLARNKLRRKTYAPDWKIPGQVWEVLESRRLGNYVVLRCRKGLVPRANYAVFTDLLRPYSYPVDKFTNSNRNSKKLFNAILREVQEEVHFFSDSFISVIKRKDGTRISHVTTGRWGRGIL